MELLEYLHIVQKRMWMIVLLCIAAVSSAVALTFVMSEKYEAKALVLVRPTEKISITQSKADKELLDFPVSGGQDDTSAQTYIEILQSRVIAERIVGSLGLDQAEEPEDTLAGNVKALVKNGIAFAEQFVMFGRFVGSSPLEDAVEDVRDNFSLEAVEDTHLLEIAYTATEPEEAARVVNRGAELFLEFMAELHTSEARGGRAFLDQRLKQSETTLAESRRKLREFKETHRTISFDTETTEEIKIISQLQGDLEKTETKLAGLERGYTPKDPLVQSAVGEREYLVETLRRRAEEINELPEKERQLAVLKLNVDVDEEIFQLLKKSHEEAQINEATKISEMRVVSPATVPLYPSEPIRLYYVLAAFAMALIVGIAVAFLLEYMDTRIWSVDAAENSLDIPVLATVPLID